MIADFGRITLLVAFLVALYAIVAAAYGARRGDDRWVRSARNAIVAVCPLVALACGLIITALVTGDFSIAYVSQVSSRGMPTYLKITALWGGQAGSLLFWNLLLSVFTAAAMLSKWREQKELMPYVIIVLGMVQLFFLLISGFVESPFVRNVTIPADGNGLNPLLRHPGMIIHPPMLYLGFVGLTIPYAFAMAALMSNQMGDNWIKTTRRWTLVAWLFLSLGLILGGRWAYDVLGWGGYWGWDPVENASLMPWLAGTAFLHSVMIQEKMRMFKMWNMFLVVITFLLVILGTFVVRSGVISSVHSFAQSAIGPFFFGFMAFMFIFSLVWIAIRHESLRTENHLVSYLSREAAFLYNNFLIIAILAVVFLFTYYPIISELFTGEKGFVGPPVYERALAPLFAALVLPSGFRLALIPLLVIALLAFGSRTALATSMLLLLAWGVVAFMRGMASRRFDPRLALGIALLALILPAAVGLAALHLGLGERVFREFYWDTSAQSRLLAFQIFDFPNPEEVLGGMGPARIEWALDLLRRTTTLNDIENFWILLLLQVGLVPFLFLAGSLLATVIGLARRGPAPVRLAALAFLVLASSNNSLATKSQNLAILVAVLIGATATVRREARQGASSSPLDPRPLPAGPPPASSRRGGFQLLLRSGWREDAP